MRSKLYIAGLPCPACKSNETEPKELRSNNGILGPGYASWVDNQWMSCKRCGVRFDPVEDEYDVIHEKLIAAGARLMGSKGENQQCFDCSPMSYSKCVEFLKGENFTKYPNYDSTKIDRHMWYKENSDISVDFDEKAGFMILRRS